MTGAMVRLWAPALVLAAGAVLSGSEREQLRSGLRLPLDAAVSTRLAERSARDLEIPRAEREAAGVSRYLYRAYELGKESAAYLYVGYYDNQAHGRTIHSPRNCMPGAGWSVVESRPVRIATAGGMVRVNQFLLAKDQERALVLYWYQGRGRLESNEYRVKWNLLLDAALRGRTEEALVRVLVPIGASPEEAFRLAARVAGEVIPSLHAALPS